MCSINARDERIVKFDPEHAFEQWLREKRKQRKAHQRYHREPRIEFRAQFPVRLPPRDQLAYDRRDAGRYPVRRALLQPSALGQHVLQDHLRQPGIRRDRADVEAQDAFESRLATSLRQRAEFIDDDSERLVERRLEQSGFAPEVIPDHRRVDAGRVSDALGRHFVVTISGEEFARRVDQRLARIDPLPGGGTSRFAVCLSLPDLHGARY